MRLVGAFLHVMLDPGCDCACMLILPSKGIVGLLRRRRRARALVAHPGPALAAAAPSFPSVPCNDEWPALSSLPQSVVDRDVDYLAWTVAMGKRLRQRVDSQGLSNASVHDASGCKSAKQSQAARGRPGCVSDLRVSGGGSFQHGVDTNGGLISSCEHLRHPLGHRRTSLAILIEGRVGLQQVRVELRVRARGLDDGDPDAPRAELMVE